MTVDYHVDSGGSDTFLILKLHFCFKECLKQQES